MNLRRKQRVAADIMNLIVLYNCSQMRGPERSTSSAEKQKQSLTVKSGEVSLTAERHVELIHCHTSLLHFGHQRDEKGDQGQQVHYGSCISSFGLYDMALASGKKASQYFIS